jgi:hypothetical protein
MAWLWRLQADVRPASQPLVWMKIERGQGLLYNTRRRNDAGPATLTGRRRWAIVGVGVVCSSGGAGRGKELQGTAPVPLPASFPSGVCTLFGPASVADAGRTPTPTAPARSLVYVCVCVCVQCLLSMEAAADCFFFCRGRLGGELMLRGARFGPRCRGRAANSAQMGRLLVGSVPCMIFGTE